MRDTRGDIYIDSETGYVSVFCGWCGQPEDRCGCEYDDMGNLIPAEADANFMMEDC